MKKITIQCLSLCSTIALLAACGGGGGSSSPGTTDTRTTGTSTVVATSTLVLPEQLEVVADDSSVTTASVRRGIALNRSIAAYNDAGTDYSTDEQHSHIWLQALEPIEMVNDFLCFTKQFKANEFVNEGAYRVLVDDSQCSENGDSSAQNQQSALSGSSESDTPTYLDVVVSTTRASDTDPMIVNAWIPDTGDEEMSMAVKFKATVYEGVSDNNPFGSFEFTYHAYPSMDSGQSLGGGEIKTVNTLDGDLGFTMYENFSIGDFGNTQQASVVMSDDRSAGVAITASSFEGDMSDDGENVAFALAFDEDNVLIQNNTNLASLDYKGGNGGAGVCLSKTDFKEAVWRYDLYDYITGARVELNSGFPMTYDSDGDGTDDSHGWVGYWGVWTEQEQGLSDGDIIHKEVFADSEATPQEYTVVKAPGRLIKHTVESLTLAEIEGVDFFYWSEAAQQQGYDQYVVRYLTADDGVSASGFYIVAGLSWGNSSTGEDFGGPQQTSLATPQAVTLSEWEDSLHMWSDQLGGGVQYRMDASVITFFKESYVNGSEEGIFDQAGNLALTCYTECPLGTLSLTDLVNWQGVGSPWEPEPADLANFTPHTYTISNTDANMLALVKDSNSEVVKLADNIARTQLQQSEFSWGLRTGPMVKAAVAATISNDNPWEVHNPDLVTEFYVWETGLEDWHQLTAVRDSQGSMVSFDRPIEFSYRHSDAKDRSGDAGQFNGQTMLLHYGGNGDLSGIPHKSVGDDRWYPVVNIADAVQMGPTGTEYVIKALDIEKKMAPDEAGCTNLVVNDPEAPLPTEITGNADIGTMPDVNDAPAVIGGEVQK